MERRPLRWFCRASSLLRCASFPELQIVCIYRYSDLPGCAVYVVVALLNLSPSLLAFMYAVLADSISPEDVQQFSIRGLKVARLTKGRKANWMDAIVMPVRAALDQ